jgi:hypothetical protein
MLVVVSVVSPYWSGLPPLQYVYPAAHVPQ